MAEDVMEKRNRYDNIIEYEYQGPNDCKVVFKVDKITQIIKSYKILSAPNTCHEPKKPLNWNR